MKRLGNFKIATPEKIWIDEFVYLRSKTYSFKCGNKNTNKLKDLSKSYWKNIKTEEYYKCRFRGHYKQDCDIYLTRALNHKMYLQRVRKFTLSQFGDKRCLKNETGSKPWN